MTQIGDAGLEHLRGLTSLTAIRVNETQVTEEGIKKLQRALPNCKILTGTEDESVPVTTRQGDGHHVPAVTGMNE